MAYTITVYIGYRNGFGAVLEPFINIPASDYYFWQTFYTIPIFFIMAIIFAGTSRLLARLFKGAGTFENIFSIFCVSFTFPMFLTLWIPESLLIIFFPDQRLYELGGFKVIPLWLDYTRQIIGIVWPLVVIIIGISIIEKIKWYHSLVITILAFIPTAILMILFIR